ncbi:MAG: hypothetical protein AB1768_05925 [Pseudomonadota bacterium]|jgi:hypothetical protein
MKTISVTDVGQLKNELAKYKKGKKLEIRQFNQAARLAWLGLAVLSPLDPEDPDCRAWLLYLQRPTGLAEHVLLADEELFLHIHMVDAEQGEALVRIIEQGVKERAAQLDELNRRDFYFTHFYRGDGT